MLFEEFCLREELSLDLGPIGPKVLVHGHCHQKAFNAITPVEKVLRMVPDLEIEMIDSGCCGMAGVFGYASETYETSMEMGELSLFPALRKEGADSVIVADGASCRHQIQHGTQRDAVHVVRIIRQALRASDGGG